MSRKNITYPLTGGIVGSFGKPGSLIDCINYYCGQSGGYVRFPGYERFSGAPSPSVEPDAALSAARRAAITAAPGSGAIQAIAEHQNTVYVLRGGVLSKATQTGWEQVATGWPVTVATWQVISATFSRTNDVLLFCNGVDGLYSLGYGSVTSNFLPAAFDGNAPDFIAEHGNRLFLAWEDGRVVFSAPGDPYDYNSKSGAGMYLCRMRLNGIKSFRGSLYMFSERGIKELRTDDTPTGWMLVDVVKGVNTGPGLWADTGAALFVAGPMGITTLSDVQEVGQFAQPATTQRLGWVGASFKNANLLLVDAARQTALVFTGGRTLAVTYQGNELVGFGDMQAPDNVVSGCMLPDGRLFVGCRDGFVYELMTGSSADGAALRSVLHLSDMDLEGFGYKKQVHKMEVVGHAEGSETFKLKLAPVFDWKKSKSTMATATMETHEIDKIRLDDDYIDAPPMPFSASTTRSGDAERIGLIIEHSGTDLSGLTLAALDIQFTPRTQTR